MTIFYGGQVLVFDNFPADKAKEVMLLASNASSQTSNSYTSTPVQSKINSGSSFSSGTTVVQTTGNKNIQGPKPQPQPGVSGNCFCIFIISQQLFVVTDFWNLRD